MDVSLTPPTAAEFRALYLSTGWGDLSEAQAERALAGSWAVCTVRDSAGEAVGVGRVISDGALHACVNEMIVREDVRGGGVGSAILTALSGAIEQAGIRQVQLFAAKGRASFYAKHGFVPRDDDAPGMQLP